MDNDRAGITSINAGHSALFEDIFRSHFKGLHLYASTIVKDAALAEEIVQDVFYKLWEKKDTIAIQQSVAAYLYKAVHNASLNNLKHNKVKDRYKANVVNYKNEVTKADERIVLKELQSKIETALNDLPPQCRIIFQLSRYEELKYQMIADRLGLSVKTVENQMGKALKILRRKLIDYLPVIALLFINLNK